MGLKFQQSEQGFIKTSYIPCSLCRKCKHYVRIVDNTSSFVAECQNGSSETAAYLSQSDNFLEQGFCSSFEQKNMDDLASDFAGKKRTKFAMPFAILALIVGSVIAFRENGEIGTGTIIVVSFGVCILAAIIYRKFIKKQ